jgi:hypothetical protein
MSLGQTMGSPNTPYGTKVFYKPSMGRIIFRKPGVLRRSTKVLDRNKRWAAAPPSPKCKGKPWKEFVACLRKEAPR